MILEQIPLERELKQTSRKDNIALSCLSEDPLPELCVQGTHTYLLLLVLALGLRWLCLNNNICFGLFGNFMLVEL